MTKEFIKNYYEINGLAVTKIKRARKDDGWFVYHPYGFETKSYKPAIIISETDTELVRQTQPYAVRSDFIDSPTMLEIAVLEGRNRSGKKSSPFIRVETP